MKRYALLLKKVSSLIYQNQTFVRVNSRILIRRAFSTNNEEERIRKLKEKAKQSEQLWDTLVFDRNISFFSRSFFVLLFVTLALHFYNKYNGMNNNDVINEAFEKEKRNVMELEKKRNK